MSVDVLLQWVGSIDLAPNEEADSNVVLEPSESWTAQEAVVTQKVEELLAGEKIDALLCVAGGWAGGNAASKGMSMYKIQCLQKTNCNKSEKIIC